MQFTSHRRRGAPSVIIVSLIDVLMVVLIFLVVTTTYKQQPSVKLALPESKQQKSGGSETIPLVVTIAKQPPIYLNQDPVSVDRLQTRLVEAVKRDPQTILAIRADTEAPFGQIIKVMDAAKAANIKTVSAYTKNANP
jgi:biopolymer transport protein ExbD